MYRLSVSAIDYKVCEIRAFVFVHWNIPYTNYSSFISIIDHLHVTDIETRTKIRGVPERCGSSLFQGGEGSVSRGYELGERFFLLFSSKDSSTNFFLPELLQFFKLCNCLILIAFASLNDLLFMFRLIFLGHKIFLTLNFLLNEKVNFMVAKRYDMFCQLIGFDSCI